MSFTHVRCACGCGSKVEGIYHRDGKMYAWVCIWKKVRLDDLEVLMAAERQALKQERAS